MTNTTAATEGVNLQKVRHDIKGVMFALKTAYRASHAKPALKAECDAQVEECFKRLEAIVESLREDQS